MTNTITLVTAFSALVSTTTSFSLLPSNRALALFSPLKQSLNPSSKSTLFQSQPYEGVGDEEPKLITEDINEKLESLKSQYPTSAVDYLAAARKRAEEARASVNSASTDEEWMELAQKNNAASSDDGWEASLADAASAENQILIPSEFQTIDGEGDSDDEDEPKLLIF